MLELVTTSTFRKDLKIAKKRGYDLSLIEFVKENTLPQKYKDHVLTGNYRGFRECHISPDWLLIYVVDKDKLVLIVSRTGTHSDLFS